MASYIIVCKQNVANVVRALPLEGGWGNGVPSNNGLRRWGPSEDAFVADPDGTLDGIAAFMAGVQSPVDRWQFVDTPLATAMAACGWENVPPQE